MPTRDRRHRALDTRPSRATHADQRGQGMVEYAFILILVSIVAIAIVTIIGHQTTNQFSDVQNSFPR